MKNHHVIFCSINRLRDLEESQNAIGPAALSSFLRVDGKTSFLVLRIMFVVIVAAIKAASDISSLASVSCWHC